MNVAPGVMQLLSETCEFLMEMHTLQRTRCIPRPTMEILILTKKRTLQDHQASTQGFPKQNPIFKDTYFI